MTVSERAWRGPVSSRPLHVVFTWSPGASAAESLTPGLRARLGRDRALGANAPGWRPGAEPAWFPAVWEPHPPVLRRTVRRPQRRRTAGARSAVDASGGAVFPGRGPLASSPAERGRERAAGRGAGGGGGGAERSRSASPRPALPLRAPGAAFSAGCHPARGRGPVQKRREGSGPRP